MGLLGVLAICLSTRLRRNGWIAAAVTAPPVVGLVLAQVFC